MPTVSESTDLEMRAGKAASILEYYVIGTFGEDTTYVSLRILKYDHQEAREMMHAAVQSTGNRRI